MAAPTPETLELYRLLLDKNPEQQCLNYLNQHIARINVNYKEGEQSIILLALPDYKNVSLRLLDLGAEVPKTAELIGVFLEGGGFQPPLAGSRNLMMKLIENGVSKNDMLIMLCCRVSGTNLNLLPVLTDLGDVDFNYHFHVYDFTPLISLIENFGNGDNFGIFMQMLRFLIAHGANPNLRVGNTGTAYDALAMSEVNNKARIRSILDEYRPPQAAAPQAAAPQAAPQAAPDYKQLWLEELEKKNADLQKIREYAPHVNINDPEKNPLRIAIQNKNINLLKVLLDLGANPNLLVNEKTFFPWNNVVSVPVWYFCVNNEKMGAPHNLNKRILEELRKKGADFNTPIENESVLFHILGLNGKTKIISYFEYFLKSGTNVDTLNRAGNSILFMFFQYSALSGDVELFVKLIQHGAPLDNKGKSIIYSFDSKYIKNSDVLHAILVRTNVNYVCEHAMSRFRSGGYFITYTDFEKFANVLLSFNPDFKAIYSDGKTFLTKLAECATLISVFDNYNDNLIQIFSKVIEKGADPNFVDSSGKKAYEYITRTGPSGPLFQLREFLEPKMPKDTKPWTGFTKADIAFTNEVFHQVTHAQDLAISYPGQVLFSMCPVCLKYVEHSTGSCMYMTHSCVEQAGFEGYYHKKLWNTYSYMQQLYDARGNPAGQRRVIEWCTLCGRICKDHHHYELGKVFLQDGKTMAPIPKYAGEGDYFAVDCSTNRIGGGGIKEKVNRYRRFREVVLFLNQQVGNMTFEDAINTLVEETWEAPLATRRLEVNYALARKEYNYGVRNELFPVPKTEPNRVYANLAYPNASNTSLQPLVFANSDETHRNVMEHLSGDTENIIQFRHRMADGTINNHDQPNQQIALDNLMGYLKDVATQQNSPDFGMCWQHADLYLTTVTDPTHPPPKCTARLYPAEILAAIEGATYASPANKEKDMQVYNAYRVAFNRKFAAAGGTRRTRRGARRGVTRRRR